MTDNRRKEKVCMKIEAKSGDERSVDVSPNRAGATHA